MTEATTPAAKPRQSRQVEPAEATTPAAKPKRQGRSQIEVEPTQRRRIEAVEVSL